MLSSRRSAAVLALVSAVLVGSPAWALELPHGLLENLGSPMGKWFETDLTCRTVTTWRSSGEGCGLTFRSGETAYFHGGIGFLRAPQFERYVRIPPAATSSFDPEIDTTSTEFRSSPGTTVIENVRPVSYFLEAGPGVAFWPTRQVNLHLELGGFLGVVDMQASQALQTGDSNGLALGVFGGGGFNYRLPSRPLAIGFNYRVQMIPYGGITGGEHTSTDSVRVGHSVVGFGHSFGISIILRTEDDRTN